MSRRSSRFRTVRDAVVLSLLVAVLGAPVAGQQAAGEPPPELTVGERLDQLNSTLERIAELLERQVESQRLDLALKRVQFGSVRVETLERDLRSAEDRRSSLSDEQYRIRSRLEMMAGELEEVSPENLEGRRPMYEQMIGQAERELEILDTRIVETEQRIIDLEAELTRRRDDLRSIQDQLDRELAGL